MWEITVEGVNCTRSRAPDPEGTPLEIAQELLRFDFQAGYFAAWPDGTPVILSRCEFKKHGRGKRLVREEVQRFTLGELHPDTQPTEKGAEPGEQKQQSANSQHPRPSVLNSRKKVRRPLHVLTAADCKGCGACCRHVGHPMFMLGSEVGFSWPPETPWINLPDELKRRHREYLADRGYLAYRGYLADLDGDDGEPCYWLQPDGTCAHYEHRPDVCREFEVSGDSCLRFRREQGFPPARLSRGCAAD
jgi:Fe-S-cluster containining protein